MKKSSRLMRPFGNLCGVPVVRECASLERDFRLRDVGRRTELDAALFGAFAGRWDSAGGDADVGASLLSSP